MIVITVNTKSPSKVNKVKNYLNRELRRDGYHIQHQVQYGNNTSVFGDGIDREKILKHINEILDGKGKKK